MRVDTKTRWLFSIAVVLIFTKIALYFRFFGNIPFDFRSFYLAAKSFSFAGNPYNPDHLRDLASCLGITGPVLPYLYPPILAFYLSPISSLSPLTAAHLWEFLSLAAFASLIASVLKLAPSEEGDNNSLFRYLTALLLFLILPFDYNFILGQVNIFVLLLIIQALVQSSIYRRDTLAGILLAPAIFIKVTPALLLLFFFINRRYKIIFGCLLGALLLLMPTLCSAAGREGWKAFFTFLPAMTYGKDIPALFPAANEANFSIAGFLARISSLGSAVHVLTLVIIGILLSLLSILHWRTADKANPAILTSYMTLMIIASPLAYLHHVIYLYPALFALIITLRKNNFTWLMLLAVSFCAGIDFPDNYYKMKNLPTFLLSLNLYPLLFIFTFCLVQMREPSAKH